MKRVAVTAAALVALSVVAVVAHPERASACSCAAFTDADAYARADAVFVGRVVGYGGSGGAGNFSSTDPALWRFSVSQVYKGSVRALQDVVSEVSGASCGLEIPRVGEYVVFATVAGSGLGPSPAEGQFYAGLCGGTRSTSAGLLAPELATAHPPLPAPPLSPLDPRTETGDSGVASRWIWIAVATAAGAAAGIAIFVVRKRRTRGI
jgi:hypothetical protein